MGSNKKISYEPIHNKAYTKNEEKRLRASAFAISKSEER